MSGLSRLRLQQWALGLLILTSLISGYYAYFGDPHSVLSREDGAAKWEERLQPIRQQLPETVREVGYISDDDSTARVQEYSLTRYALALSPSARGSNTNGLLETLPSLDSNLIWNTRFPCRMKSRGLGMAFT